jgi:hypothetical protein
MTTFAKSSVFIYLVLIYLMMDLAWAETCSIHVQVIIYNKALVVLYTKTVPCLTAVSNKV